MASLLMAEHYFSMVRIFLSYYILPEMNFSSEQTDEVEMLRSIFPGEFEGMC